VQVDDLVRAFRSAAGLTADTAELALRVELEAIVARGKAAWPDVMLEGPVFVRYVADRLPRGAAPTAALARVDAEGLYLACACAGRQAKAVECFISTLGPDVDRALARMGIDLPQREDLVSTLYQIFLFGNGADRPPLITSYTGRGSLSSWARSVAVKQALTARQREQRLVQLDEELLDLPGHQTSPDLAYMRDLYLEEFRLALGRALQTVSKRERNLLRQHYLDRMSLEAVARARRVHRATAARWLAEAREHVLSQTKLELASAVHLTATELESVFSFVQRQSAFGDDVARLRKALGAE
jgi:RNA polymerase sigma-70 factor (ECF subfamily)